MQYNWKKNVGIFLASQAISVFGSSLVQYAITWHITLTTQKGLYATLAIVFGVLPQFFLAPFAGVWADRYNRKTLIILADGGIAVCTLFLAISFFMGYGSIWQLFAALAIRGLGSAVQTPCISAMLPDMVPPEHLVRINSINGSIQSLITLLSPMLSAALLGYVSLQYILLVDVVTAGLAIGVLLLFFALPIKEKLTHIEDKEYFNELKAGFNYIVKTPYLRNFFIFCSVYFFMVAPVAFLTPLQVARSFGADVWRLSAVEISFSVGMLFGGLIMTVWGGFKNKVYTMVFAGFMMALSTIALGLPLGLFWLYLGIMGVCGVVMPMFSTPATVLLQQQVDPDYLGRVFGVLTMVNCSMMPAGMLLFGPLADIVSIEIILIGTGLVLLVLSLLLLRDKALCKAGVELEVKHEPVAE